MRSIRFLYGGNMRKYVTENIAAIQFNDLISVSLGLIHNTFDKKIYTTIDINRFFIYNMLRSTKERYFCYETRIFKPV